VDVHELVVAQWDDGTVITSVVRRVDGDDTAHHFRVLRNGELLGEADTVRDAAILAGRRVPAGS
jgi:hypothetical protein